MKPLSDNPTFQKKYSLRAPFYDLLHHCSTLYADVFWRKKAALALPEQPGRVLDLCAGTGLTTREIHNQHPKASIWAIDRNPEMLTIARNRFVHTHQVQIVLGDVCSLPFPDSFFDCVVCVCGLGGVTCLTESVSEINRVLAPAGWFYSLEMFSPEGKTILPQFHRRVTESLILEFWGFRAVDMESVIDGKGFDVQFSSHRFERFLGCTKEVLARKKGKCIY